MFRDFGTCFEILVCVSANVCVFRKIGLRFECFFVCLTLVGHRTSCVVFNHYTIALNAFSSLSN